MRGMAVVSLFGLMSCPPQAADRFDVAAIHLNQSGSSNTHIKLGKGQIVIENASVKTLIRNAYGLLSFQFAGGPKWLDSEMFDIEAKTGDGQEITQDSMRPLLEHLLADRFHLKVHWETREMPIYALVVAKGGPKFASTNDGPEHGMNTSKRVGSARMRGNDVGMPELATNLGNQLGRYVVDETGLQGHYDFVLHWDPDPTSDSAEPSLFTAVEEQLGLRLESKKGPMKVLVIDNAEEPTEN